MKVCIIGNSHVACLKAAYETTALSWITLLDFFSLPGGGQPQLQMRDGRLYPVRPAGRLITTVPRADIEGLDLTEYDAVIVSAAGRLVVQNKMVETNTTTHPLAVGSLCEWAWTPDETAPQPRVVSKAVFAAIMDAFVRSHGAIGLLHLLQTYYKGRVIVQPCPAPSLFVQLDHSWFINRWYGSQGQQVWKEYFVFYCSTLRLIVKELGASFCFLDHPKQAMVMDTYMDERYCTEDRWHGNESYGHLVIESIKKSLFVDQ